MHNFNDYKLPILFRMQQILNGLYNDIVASTLISFHFVALIATVSVMTTFFISYQNVIQETGMVGYVVVIGCILLPLVIVYLESIMLGRIVDMSDDFIGIGWNTVGRKTMYSKFVKSCKTLYLQQAYPYFTIHKGTFFEFCNEAVDKTITLLLW